MNCLEKQLTQDVGIFNRLEMRRDIRWQIAELFPKNIDQVFNAALVPDFLSPFSPRLLLPFLDLF